MGMIHFCITIFNYSHDDETRCDIWWGLQQHLEDKIVDQGIFLALQ